MTNSLTVVEKELVEKYHGVVSVRTKEELFAGKNILEAYKDGFKHALNAKDEKSRMILVGIGIYLFAHFVLNVGGVTALIPLTGVPLLMLSSGGSSTLSIMFGLGIAQAVIIRQKREESE